MAVPANKKVRATQRALGQGLDNAELAEVRQQLNNLIAAVRTIATKLDADAGVTDTNYNALSMDTAVGAAAPAQVDVIT